MRTRLKCPFRRQTKTLSHGATIGSQRDPPRVDDRQREADQATQADRQAGRRTGGRAGDTQVATGRLLAAAAAAAAARWLYTWLERRAPAHFGHAETNGCHGNDPPDLAATAAATDAL